MTVNARLAGLGALGFGLLPLLAGFVANPPGGDYSASAVADLAERSAGVVIGDLSAAAETRQVAFHESSTSPCLG